MPERIFKYHTLTELKQFAKDLAQAATTGSLTELRNSSTGFAVTTSGLTPGGIRQTLMEVRYEIWSRGAAGDTAAAAIEPTDPRRERIMRVETYVA